MRLTTLASVLGTTRRPRIINMHTPFIRYMPFVSPHESSPAAVIPPAPPGGMATAPAIMSLGHATAPPPQPVLRRPELAWLCASTLFHDHVWPACMASSQCRRFEHIVHAGLQFALCSDSTSRRTDIMHAILFWNVLDLSTIPVLERLFASSASWSIEERWVLAAARAQMPTQPVLAAIHVWLYETHGHDAAGACAQFGLTRAVELLCSQEGQLVLPQVFTVQTATRAARGSNGRCLAVLRERAQCPWDEGVTAAAAEGGNVSALYVALDGGCPWDQRSGEWVLEWIWSQPEHTRWIDDLLVEPDDSAAVSCSV